jgi:flagellar biosynthesis/type III secretory pathway M-ring protein FliF/YscJ
MRYLQKMPLLFALAAAFCTGIIGFSRSLPQIEILINMLLIMVLFFIAGLFSRTTILKILNEIDEKRKKKEMEEKEKKQREEAEETKKEENLGKTIDFTVGNIDDDAFNPLHVSEFIRKELNHD